MNQNDLFVLQAIRRAKLTDIIAQENLEANREGRFTEFQKTVLKTVAGGLKWRDFFIIAGMILLSAFSVGFIGGWALLLLVVLLIAAIFQIRKLHRQHLERIIAEGVQSAVGRYFFNFDKNAYEIDVSGEKGLNGVMVSTVPGAYKYYFVRKLKFVLSVEPCNPQLVTSFDPGKQSIEKVLKRAVGFTNNDLKANRDGMLSENQKNYIKKTEIVLPLIVTVVLGVAIISLFIISLLNPSGALGEFFFLILIILVILLLIGIPVFIKMRKAYMDLKECSVLSVTGIGSKSQDQGSWVLLTAELATNLLGPAGNLFGILLGIASGGKKPTGKYFIAQKAFRVSETAYMALVDGVAYTAYYLPKTGEILSIEQTQS